MSDFHEGSKFNSPNDNAKNNTYKERFSAYWTASRIAKIAIFSALSVILYFLRFPISFLFPSFLELNFSDIPALIGSFSLGPFAGFIIVLIKVLIKLPFSSTFCVGELADLIIGSLFVVTAGLIYKKHKDKKGALIGMLLGGLVSVFGAILSNLFLIPFYVFVMNWSFDGIVALCQKVIPFINSDNFYAVYSFVAVLPFNVLRCGVTTLITFLIYKRISNLLRRF